MPVELFVEYNDGNTEVIYIPLTMMRGEKQKEIEKFGWTVYSDWPWTHPYYEVKLSRSLQDIKSIEVDPTKRMADIDRDNNSYPFNLSTGVIGTRK